MKTRENEQIIHKVISIRLTSGFSAETLQARKNIGYQEL
jgi:hypothetical protein